MGLIEAVDHAFTHYLFVSNVVSASLLLCTADCVRRRVRGGGLDVERVCHVLLAGGALGVFNHAWYSLLDAAIVQTDMVHVLQKILLDQLVAGPLYTSVCLCGIRKLDGQSNLAVLQEGQSNLAVLQDWQAAFWKLYKAEWRFMPLVQCVNFALVPPTHTVMCVNLGTLVWELWMCRASPDEKTEERSPSCGRAPISSLSLQWAEGHAPLCGHAPLNDHAPFSGNAPLPVMRRLSVSGVRMISIDQSHTSPSRDARAAAAVPLNAGLHAHAAVDSVLVSMCGPRDSLARDHKPRDHKSRDNEPGDLKPRDKKPRDKGPRDHKPRDNKPRDQKSRDNDDNNSASPLTTENTTQSTLQSGQPSSDSAPGSDLYSTVHCPSTSDSSESTPRDDRSWMSTLRRFKRSLRGDVDTLAFTISGLSADVRRIETSIKTIDALIVHSGLLKGLQDRASAGDGGVGRGILHHEPVMAAESSEVMRPTACHFGEPRHPLSLHDVPAVTESREVTTRPTSVQFGAANINEALQRGGSNHQIAGSNNQLSGSNHKTAGSNHQVGVSNHSPQLSQTYVLCTNEKQESVQESAPRRRVTSPGSLLSQLLQAPSAPSAVHSTSEELDGRVHVTARRGADRARVRAGAEGAQQVTTKNRKRELTGTWIH